MSDLNLSIKLTTEGGKVVVKEIDGVEQAAKGAADALGKTDKAGRKAKGGLDAAGKGAKKTETDIDRLNNRLTKAISFGALFYAGMQAIGGLRTAATLADDFNILEQRIKTATKDTGDFDQVWSQLYQNAQDNGAVMQGTVELFQRLSSSRKELKATNTQMLAFTNTVQQLGVIGGSSTEAMKNGLTQLAQGLGGGVLRAEEFNSILENVPELAVRIGQGMGNIGVGELRAMVLEGEVLSEDVFAAILSQVPEIAAEFEKLPPTIARSRVEFDNATASILSRLDEAVDVTGTWASLLSDAAGAMDDMSTEELESYINLLELAGLTTGALLAAMYTAPAAAAIWSRGMAVASVASGAFAAQNALTTKSLISMRTAAYGVASAFIGWQIGSYLRDEFAVVERVGIAMMAGIHTGAISLGGAFDALGAEIKYALTNPLDFARNKMIDFFQWLAGLGDGALSLLGLDGAFDELDGKLEGFRSKSGAEHKAALEEMRAQTKAKVQQVSDEYADMFAQVGKGADNTKKKLTDMAGGAGGEGDAGANAGGVNELNKALLSLYNTQMLNAQAVDAQGRALEGVDLELFKATFTEAAELPKNAADSIREYATAALAAQTALQSDTYLESMRQENELLRIRLEQGEDEYNIQKALLQLKGGNPATLAAIEDELRAQQDLNDEIRKAEELAGGGLGGMRDELGEISDAVKELGGDFANAFGGVAEVLAKITQGQADYKEALKQVGAERKALLATEADSETRKQDLLALEQKEAALSRQNFSAQMSQYGALAGAASQMFGEQSREREALHKMEMAFGAVEIAMALQKAGANALTAITSAFSAPFPLNFAAGAAMIAIMAGLGVFSGSSSAAGPSAAELQETQGTGTVLGDSTAKSSSIENTFGRIEELELDQYHELRKINDNIKALSGGIAQLAVNLVQNYGRFDASSYGGALGTTSDLAGLGAAPQQTVSKLISDFDPVGGAIEGVLGDMWASVIGGISETERELIDSGISFDTQNLGQIMADGLSASYYAVIKTTESKLWGLSSSSSQSTEYTGIEAAALASISALFSYIGGSVTDAVNLLGLNPENALGDFAINLPNVSFKDLSGDEIEAELEAIFSQQADLITKYLVPGIAQYQQMGEGLFETLLRVAQEQAVFNAQMDALGLTMGSAAGITAEAQLEISQSIITLMGGIEEFKDATADYLNAFYTGAEQFDYLSGTLQKIFTDLGQPLPATRDGFRALVDGIDRTTESGQQLFATLLQLAPGMDEFYSVLEERAEFEAGLAGEFAALDATALQQSLTDLNAWYDEQIAAAEELGADTTMIERLYGRKRYDIIADELEAINKQHTSAAEKLVSEYDKIFNRIGKLSEGIAGDILSIQRAAPGWNEVSYQTGQIADLRGNIGVGSASDQIGTIEGLQGAIMARYNAELARNQELQQAQQARHQQLQAAAQERYQVEKAAFDAMRQAADQLLQAADAMLLSAASPALLGSQLSEAQSQFSNLFNQAQNGDADAAGQLQGVGSSYLDIAKSYYAQGSDEYKDIFNQIQNAYRNVGASAPEAPPVPPEVRAYHGRSTRLQQSTINELSDLQTLLDDLREQEQTALEAQQAELLATQQAQVDAVNQSAADIVNAIHTTFTGATERMIMEMRTQRDEARQQSANVVKELGRVRTELTRTQNAVYNGRRVG